MSAANTLEGDNPVERELSNRRTESPFTETQADAHVLSSSDVWSDSEGAMSMSVAATSGGVGWGEKVTGEQSSPLLTLAA